MVVVVLLLLLQKKGILGCVPKEVKRLMRKVVL